MEKYKRYGYEDAYDTEKENDWTNRLNLDDCIEIMNNQFNEIIELKRQLTIKEKALEIANEQFNSINYQYFDESNIDFKKEWIEQAKKENK